MPVSRKVNKSFFKKWTKEMAYVLGFFAADGYITVNKRGGHYWSIQISDRDLLVSIRKAIGSNHKIGVRSGSEKESTLYRLQIGSIEMCNDLRKLGFGERKTKSLSIPNIPDKWIPSFIRGYFDGDGNVWTGLIHKNRQKPLKSMIVMFTSCPFLFLESLLTRLRKLGIKGGSIYTPKSGSFSRLQFQKEDSLKIAEIMYNSGAFGDLYLDRKKQVFEAF